MDFFDQFQHQTKAEREYLLGAPIIHAALAGTATRAQYIAFLTQAYHHVKHTVPLLMACGARLPERYEWLREAMAEYITEEIGHQEWILNDIKACGADAEAVRHGKPGDRKSVVEGQSESVCVDLGGLRSIKTKQ